MSATFLNSINVADRALGAVAEGDVVVQVDQITEASGLKSILWFTPFFQPIGMPCANGGEYLLGGNAAGGFSPHGIANVDNFLAKPLFDRGVTLLQGPQTGSDNFTSGSI